MKRTMLQRDPTSCDPAVRELRARLDAFYAAPAEYPVFRASVPRDDEYDTFVPMVLKEVPSPARVLELGAGRSGFADYVAKRGYDVQYDAQDVTAANADHLQPRTRHLHVGDITGLQGDYDLVFSTYVLEHVSAPREFLENVRRLLVPGGWHVVICPRYDLPGYLCPSLRHLSAGRRLLMMGRLAATRLQAAFAGGPRFLVNLDPAVFHRPFRIDADAVHLVSRRDVERWHRANGFDEVRRLSLPRPTWKDQVRVRCLTTALACRKARG